MWTNNRSTTTGDSCSGCQSHCHTDTEEDFVSNEHEGEAHAQVVQFRFPDYEGNQAFRGKVNRVIPAQKWLLGLGELEAIIGEFFSAGAAELVLPSCLH